jgi:Protein of unknown function (DUF3592)
MSRAPDYAIFFATWPLWLLIVWAVWNMRRDSKDQRLVQRSLAWPESQGKVVNSAVVWGHVEVSYEYHAGGSRYLGSYQINLSPIIPSSIGHGGAAAGQYNKESGEALREFYPGKSVVVRYNPEKPSQSVFYYAGEVGANTGAQANTAAPKFLVLT